MNWSASARGEPPRGAQSHSDGDCRCDPRRANAASPTSVETPISMRLVTPQGVELPTRASLRYDSTDPYAIRLCFDDDLICWTFARELLADGLDGSAGIGDVQVWPRPRLVVALRLSSPYGNALFEAPRGTLVRFLLRTYLIVGRGRESEYNAEALNAAATQLLAGRPDDSETQPPN